MSHALRCIPKGTQREISRLYPTLGKIIGIGMANHMIGEYGFLLSYRCIIKKGYYSTGR
jgi:hypothetical protein